MRLKRSESIRIQLYEELNKKNMNKIVCKKEFLQNKLIMLSEWMDINKGDLILQNLEEEYIIYYRWNHIYGNESLKLDSAIRIRVETCLQELDNKLKQVEESLKRHQLNRKTDYYCWIRQVVLEDGFVIMDVYVGI